MNDVAQVGFPLQADDVNMLKDQPMLLMQKVSKCSLLDIAESSGAVAKYLLEPKPTGETLKMTLSSGNLEVIRLVWAACR